MVFFFATALIYASIVLVTVVVSDAGALSKTLTPVADITGITLGQTGLQDF